MPDRPQQLYSLAAAAGHFAGVDRADLRRLIDTGRLPCYLLPGWTRPKVALEDVAAAIEKFRGWSNAAAGRPKARAGGQAEPGSAARFAMYDFEAQRAARRNS